MGSDVPVPRRGRVPGGGRGAEPARHHRRLHPVLQGLAAGRTRAVDAQQESLRSQSRGRQAPTDAVRLPVPQVSRVSSTATAEESQLPATLRERLYSTQPPLTATETSLVHGQPRLQPLLLPSALSTAQQTAQWEGQQGVRGDRARSCLSEPRVPSFHGDGPPPPQRLHGHTEDQGQDQEVGHGQETRVRQTVAGG